MDVLKKVTPKRKTGLNLGSLMAKAPKKYQREDYSKITRKEFENLLPESIPEIIKEDIGYYFDYLRNNRSTKSLRAWEKATDCIDSPNSYKEENYRPIFAFMYYDRITEGSFLPLLLTRLETACSQRKKEISISEFNKISRLSIVGFRPKIDKIDLKILQELSKEPLLVTQAITDKIDHSYATVYHHQKKLKDKLGLRIITRVNWSKLATSRIFLITKDESIYNELKDYKSYLDGQASFLWGEMNYLQYYYIRKKDKNTFYQKLQQMQQETNGYLHCFECTVTPYSGYDFDLYNLEEQRWEFDFATTFQNPKAVAKQAEKLDHQLFRNESTQEEPYELTEQEIKIINGLVGNYDLTQKELAEQLDIHAPNLSIIKNKLLEDEIITPRMMVRTFLPINCVLWCKTDKQEIIDTIVYLLQRIPYSSISPVKQLFAKDSKKQLICILQMDDILYTSLINFLIDLIKDRQLLDFRLGLIFDQYFGMSKVINILKPT
jgi:DNA-binding Lrp family transcriptional regulator